MDIFKEFSTDDTKTKEGVWFDLPEAGARLLIASTSASEFKSTMLKDAALKKLVGRTGAEKQTEKRVVEIYAKHILIGWEGLTYGGADLPYSQDNAGMILSIDEFFELVSNFASDNDNFRLEAIEEAGNS